MKTGVSFHQMFSYSIEVIPIVWLNDQVWTSRIQVNLLGARSIYTQRMKSLRRLRCFWCKYRLSNRLGLVRTRIWWIYNGIIMGGWSRIKFTIINIVDFRENNVMDSWARQMFQYFSTREEEDCTCQIIIVFRT